MSLPENPLQTDTPILPSVIGNTQDEIGACLSKVKDLNNTIHLDVMDGKFVDKQSFNFDFTIPLEHFQYHYHLMVADPMQWIDRCKGASLIVFHIEIEEDIASIIDAIHAKGIKAALAINPDSGVEQLLPYLDKINAVLVMTVIPGRYGSPLRLDALSHIRMIAQVRPEMPIIVDGSVSDLTIGGMYESGATHFVVGSHLQKHSNPHEAVKILLSKLK